MKGVSGKQRLARARFVISSIVSYLPWAKANKRSWKDDEYKLPVLKAFFQNTLLRDVTPFLVERFKQVRLETPTKHDTRRSLATVSLEMALLSRIFSLAMDFKEVEANPCLKVAKLKLDNQRYRYLLPEEGPKLRSVLTGQRSHLAELVPVAIGTGLRKNEQLSLHNLATRVNAITQHQAVA